MSQSQPSAKPFPGWPSLLALEAGTLGAGGLVGFLTRGSADYFATLSKPSFAPPGWLFPVAWSLLYATMAYCMWLVLRQKSQERFLLLGLYLVQLVVNLAWPFLFFQLKALGLAFFWLILLFCLVVLMTIRFFSQRRLAGALLLPYCGWVAFAGVLNFFIARMNP